MSKRVLSLVLALVMVLGTFGSVFAEEAAVNEKVAKLQELGLVVGDAGTGNLRLADPIKRSEVSVMVVKALDLEAVANASLTFPSIFKDMSPAHWANGFVNVAVGRGFISGYPDGTFKADNDVNYAELASMLVRVLDGLTEDEQKAAVWPTTWLAKAAELGLFEGVAVANYNAPASREHVFEMVYNALTAKGSTLLVASTVEGIVVENYRTENIAKDDLVVHVMKDQVQRSSDGWESGKYYEENDEFKVTLDRKLKEKGLDVETLLGKVVTVSFDKEDKVVDIKVNNDYKYEQGALEDITAKSIKVDGKYYTIGKSEARTAVDERLYQVYLNNEDVHYDDFEDVVDDEFDEFGEFARITVRNGKVLFIDAFQFEDIAPVAKDIDAKDKVAFYDDSKDGAVNTITVDEDAYVINFVDGKMTLGEYKDIAANDVIHWFYEDSKAETLTVFVRPADDNMVEGKYTEANAAKAKESADIKIMVDKVDYPANVDILGDNDNRDAVYSTISSELEFYTLSEDYDDELEPFEKEEVVLLRDMFGKVQLISTDKVSGKFYAVVSNTSRSQGEVRLVKADNSNEWFETNRNTKYVNVGSGTKDAQFNEFEMEDLVLATADEELLTELEYVEADFGPEEITKLTNDVIDFAGEYFYIGKKTVLFDVSGKTFKGMTVAEFRKNYDLDKEIEGYVVENAKDAKLVDVIVITEATAKDNAKYEDLVVKVTRVRVTGKTYRVDVVNALDEKETYYVDEDVADAELRSLNVVAGSVIEINVPKEADKDGNKEIKAMEEILDEDEAIFKVLEVGRDKARNENYLVLEDGETPAIKRTVWISRVGDVFGDPKVGGYVAIETLDKYDTTFAVDVRTKKAASVMADWANYGYEAEVVVPDTTAADVIALINGLTVTNPVAQAEVDAVEVAREAFDALLPENRAKVIDENYADLVSAEAKIRTQATDNQNAVDSAKLVLEYEVNATDELLFEATGVDSDLTYTISSDDSRVAVDSDTFGITVTRGAIDYEATVTVTITTGLADATLKTVTATFRVEVPHTAADVVITAK